MGRFVHLHLHSEYSLLDGACRISEIPEIAKANGQDAVAITDHGVMYGVVEFYKACRAAGVKPIIGCEVYVATRSRFDKDHDADRTSDHLILLVENETGYRNLIRMVSLGFTEGFYNRPRIDMELLEKHHEGLIALSACLAGRIPRAITAGRFDDAEAYARRMSALFGKDRFYLEVQDHGIPEQQLVNRSLLKISQDTGIGLVATNDVHYLRREDAEAHEILLCIQMNKTVEDGKLGGFVTNEFWMKGVDEMERLFAAYPGAVENTGKIADMCDFDFTFGHTELPRFHPENGLSSADYLAKLAETGFARRILKGHITFTEEHDENEYRERIAYELAVITKMGYCDYYLIVWDFVNYAKSAGIPVGPGRGSGAGSLVAFLIGITDIDPLRFDLLFERFLNPERVSMPDFDIDFCYDRRDEVIAYVREKYGSDRTSQIVTFGTMAARAAVRDVGRALGMSYAETDAVARLIPRTLGITLKDALAQEKLKDLYESDAKVRRLLDVAMKLEGMPRHSSTHAAGVVITENPLSDYVPLSVNNGVVVTQFDMNTIADLGLLKFDFLALRYLTVIAEAERQIRKREPSFDISTLPLDDPATYATISSGRTDGVFQLESGGMRQTLMQMKPSRIDDVIAAIALYRPGPMDAIPKYIENSRDPSRISYPTPLLKPILDVTNGCIVYQEQVMQIFSVVAGYSFGRADVVRRAIAKKKKDVLESERASFLAGAAQHGVSESAASELFEEIIGFANYAFNKSHAAAYSVLSYRTAYLKTHYPLEYYSALLTSVLGSEEKMNDYIAECKQNDVRVLPPHVNHSARDFSVESTDDRTIRFGLLALRNMGRQFSDDLIAERLKNGDYRSFGDFIHRAASFGLNKRQLEVLIKSGALDGLGARRSQMLSVYESVLDAQNSVRRSGMEGQLDLFSARPAAQSVACPDVNDITFPDLPELPKRELLMLEKESAGIYFSGYVLDAYSRCIADNHPDQIRSIREAFAADSEQDPDENPEFVTAPAKDYADGQTVRIAGMITGIQTKRTKNGEPMGFVTIEDGTGSMELVIFPKIFSASANLMRVNETVLVSGTISHREEELPKLLVNKIRRLIPDSEYDEASSKPPEAEPQDTAPQTKPPVSAIPTRLYLRVSSLDSPSFLRASAFIELFPGPLEVIVYDGSTSKAVRATHLHAAANPFTDKELKELLGNENVVFR